MPGRGPAPKPADKRRRRNATGSTTSLVSDGVLRGSPLPRSGYSVRIDGAAVGLSWPDQTKAWWLHWRQSAMAQQFTSADWDFLLETAVLHAEFWNGDRSVASELRLRVAKFGATPEDRLRLKIEIDPEESAVETESPAISPDVSRLADYRGRYAAGGEQ
ncbi:phage terminase small subunit [Kitasatospora mediocidica]